MRRTRVAAVLVAVATPLLSVAAQLPAVAATTMTATESVNIRSGPSTSASIVGGLYRGQAVTAVSAAQGWTKVRYAGTNAYVASRYLRPGKNLPAVDTVNGGTVRVATTALNLRTGPGLSYAKIAVLAAQTRVTLTGKTARGYTEVLAGAKQGWVSTQYLANASGLPAVIGTRVATADLLIRTTSGADYDVVGEVKKGARLEITGATQNGRAQIIYAKAVRWVTAKYLGNPVANQPTVPGLPTIVGTRYATTDLLIRSSSSDTYTVITEVPKGTPLSVTGVVANQRAQIVYANAVRWVTAKYLSGSPPAAGGSASVYAVEKGLKPNAIKVHRAARAAFPQITTYYGVRRDPIPDHPSGLALDLMIPSYRTASGKALGQRVALWAKANQATLGVNYVIWNQRIWNIQRDKEGWRFMANRGGDSANHKDHVHITVFR